jgi:hypothetical protein
VTSFSIAAFTVAVFCGNDREQFIGHIELTVLVEEG